MAQGKKIWAQRKWGVLSLTTAAALGLAVGYLTEGDRFGLSPILTFVFLLGLAALACVPLAPWWNRLDDMQKQSQYESWYWGGTIGMLLGLLGLIASVDAQSEMAKGGLIVVMAQFVGYVLYSIWFRIRNGGGGL